MSEANDEQPEITDIELSETWQFKGASAVKKRRFLAGFMCHARIAPASRDAGVSRNAHYYWMLRDEDYRKAFYEVRRWIADRIEESLVDRLVHGWDEPVFHEGVEVGQKRKYDNTNAMKYLERVNSEVFGDTSAPEESISAESVAAALLAMQGKIKKRGDDEVE